MIFITILLLPLLSTTTALLAGHEQGCTNEGELVDVPIITDPCIKCYCKGGYVKCERSMCPDLEGCHMILYRPKRHDSCCDVCAGCTEDGVHYSSGETWKSSTDACITKQCKAGVVTTSKSVCPVLKCNNPVLLDGDCCPSCPTCERNNQTYREGESVTPDLDVCVSCTCKDGKMSCIKNACPVLNCPDYKIVHKEGECCPSCSGTRTTFTVPNMCLFKHDIHRAGKSMRVNECTHCTCREGSMQCTRDSCPALDCLPEEQVYPRTDSCCPVCKPKIIHLNCIYEDSIQMHSSTWEDGCATCFCDNGTVTCRKPGCEAEQHCPIETHQLKFTDGECCPTCVERDAMCTVYGDPHYITFDKKIYDFQGTCRYTLAKDCANKDFAVYTQNFDRYNMPGAWTKSVTILLKGTKIGLHKSGKVRISKSRVSLPYSVVGEFTVRYDNLRIVVELSSGLTVIWNTESYLEIHVSPRYKGNMCGLCGNYNGDADDDFLGKGEKLYGNAVDFAQSWKHGKKQCDIGLSQNEVQQRCQDNFSKWGRAHQECSILKSEALKSCRQKIDVDPYYKSCVTDSCNCPRHRKCTCDAVTAYVRECERIGLASQAPLNYSCGRQRRRILERVMKTRLL